MTDETMTRAQWIEAADRLTAIMRRCIHPDWPNHTPLECFTASGATRSEPPTRYSDGS